MPALIVHRGSSSGYGMIRAVLAKAEFIPFSLDSGSVFQTERWCRFSIGPALAPCLAHEVGASAEPTLIAVEWFEDTPNARACPGLVEREEPASRFLPGAIRSRIFGGDRMFGDLFLRQGRFALDLYSY
ncbi:MAG: hypothetical protein WDM96_16960 [Lacunisphaera sp.]